jgi:hypothetical protein
LFRNNLKNPPWGIEGELHHSPEHDPVGALHRLRPAPTPLTCLVSTSHEVETSDTSLLMPPNLPKAAMHRKAQFTVRLPAPTCGEVAADGNVTEGRLKQKPGPAAVIPKHSGDTP